MGVLGQKGLRITFWSGEIGIIPSLSLLCRGWGSGLLGTLSTKGKAESQLLLNPPVQGFLSLGGGLGRAECPGRETPCPHSGQHTMTAFSP
jgi:hypothetical protein